MKAIDKFISLFDKSYLKFKLLRYRNGSVIIHKISLAYMSVWAMVFNKQKDFCAPRFAQGHPDNTDYEYLYKHSSHWQTDVLKWWEYEVYKEGIQNLPKLNVKPSFKINMNRNAKHIACSLTEFKELKKSLRINHETWKICESSSKTALEKLYVRNIITVDATGRHFATTNKVRHRIVKTDYIMHNTVE